MEKGGERKGGKTERKGTLEERREGMEGRVGNEREAPVIIFRPGAPEFLVTPLVTASLGLNIHKGYHTACDTGLITFRR